MKTTLFALVVALAVGVMSCRQSEQSPQVEQPVAMDYSDLPAIPAEVVAAVKADPDFTVALSFDDLTNSTKEEAIEHSKLKTAGAYIECRATRPESIAPSTPTTTECNCPKTQICEFPCGKMKYIVYGIPDCCRCYQKLGGGGWIECEGTGCASRSVPCNISR